MSLQPYLFLNGRCEEAVEYYRTALGAEVVMLMRNRESPDPPPPDCLPPGSEDKIMHAEIRIGGSPVLMSDGMADGKPEFRGFSISLTVASPEDAKRRFDAIADGGSVTMPLGKTFFSPAFGMATDRFGVPWMVYVTP